MSIKERIATDLKTAMKAKDQKKVAVLRMVLSELKYAQTAGDGNQELADGEALKVVTSYWKRLKKSMEDFPEGDKRAEIAGEIQIVEMYLPQKASREQVEKVVDNLLSTETERNFGVLMKKVLAQLGQAGDGKVVSEVLRAKLANS